MATYLVGDLHGCFDELKLLLEKVNFEPTKDTLFLTGDLIARGDQSLSCLRFVKSLGSAAQTVLGNHDLHFLATAYGIKKVKARDRVDDIFTAPDFIELVNWLRHQPLLIHNEKHNFVLTHSGISPDWDLATAKECAQQVEQVLASEQYLSLLTQMYENYPDCWSPNLQGIERLRYSINVLTRMRFCYQDHRLDFDCKLPIEQAPLELQPWFAFANPLYKQYNIIFGHWASLVNSVIPQGIYALDTGCIWNNHLTMLRWEDQQYFVQPALKDYSQWN